jgi:hypothetical protein
MGELRELGGTGGLRANGGGSVGDRPERSGRVGEWERGRVGVECST